MANRKEVVEALSNFVIRVANDKDASPSEFAAAAEIGKALLGTL